MTDEATIRRLPLFDGLDDASITALGTIARQHTLRTDETLFRQGDYARSFYAVAAGGVRLIEHTTEGKVVNLKVYGTGDIFGLLAVAGVFPHYAEIVAVTHSTIIAFDGEKTRHLMQRHPAIALRVIDFLVDHVHHAHDRIRQMAVEKAEQRLARALLHLCNKFGQTTANCQILVDFSQQDIAEFTGTTVETVNRMFKTWEKQGYIERRRLTIAVLDAAALGQIAGERPDVGMGYHLM